MRKYYLRKHICSLLFLSAFLCLNKVNGQITQSELEAALKAGIDPYFVETSDTISSHGPKSIVRDVLQDKNGNFWFATWHGIMGYDGKVFTNYTLKYGLKHFHVVSLYEDKKGNLWFGTARGGLYLYNGKSFKLFTTKEGLADNTVMCITEDKEGHIWFGTENGASRYDGKTFVNFTTRDGLSSNYVNSLLQDKRGKLWFGCDGITCYNGKTFTTFKNKDGLPFARVASLFEDQDENIWIGTIKGLCRYNGKSLSDFIIPKLVMYMSEDKKSNLLLAFNDYPRNQNFVLYSYDGKSFTKTIEQNYQDHGAIFRSIEDKGGNIWFGTNKGVCRYDGKTLTYFMDEHK